MSNIDNYFELFSLPTHIPVDIKQLTAAYQQLQRRYHPDNFATAAEHEKVAILQKSATINDAFQTLKDPILSAEYLLLLNGINVDIEQNIIHDNHFLMEQFELREQLDSIENGSDVMQKEQQLTHFSDLVKQKRQQAYQQLISLVESTNWPLAQVEIHKLRFLAKLQLQIERLEDQLFEL